MTLKQLPGSYSKDGSKYATTTDGSGNLTTSSTSSLGTTKTTVGAQASDGSIYFTLTDGAGALV